MTETIVSNVSYSKDPNGTEKFELTLIWYDHEATVEVHREPPHEGGAVTARRFRGDDEMAESMCREMAEAFVKDHGNGFRL